MSVERTLLPVDDFVFVTIADATTPHMGLHMIYTDYWWAVDAQERIGFLNPRVRCDPRRRQFPGRGIPQCNAHRAIVERVGRSASTWFVEARQIPAVFVESDPREWAD